MRMMIRYQNDLRVQGVLLAANNERMRIAIASQRDTVEVHKLGDCWYTEQGVEVEIEALTVIAGTDVSQFCSEMRPMTMTAGRTLSFN